MTTKSILDDMWWNIQTKCGFSCRWYLGQGTIFREWANVLASSKGGIEIWRRINTEKDAINAIYDTRKLNRKLRKMILEN